MFYSWKSLPEDRSKETLGGKGAGLFDMIEAGVPVPEFVVIPTSLCVDYMAKPAETSMKVKTLAKEIIDHFVAEFGFLPLLSVRSGARVSMPGMMDTILNVGVGDNVTKKYTDKLPDRCYADCNRRFLHMYGSTVLGIADSRFEELIAQARRDFKVETDAELTKSHLHEVCKQYRSLIERETGGPAPMSARAQIEACILAVMNSWNSERAVEYRKHNSIPDDWGTAVVIQRMVFGNMNDNSGSGVAFSRDPSDGYNELTGEYLVNAQGEDVVAGIRTPVPISEMPEKQMTELCQIATELEKHYKDMLDMEFTVEDGKLYMLQVRTAKRSARAWVVSSLSLHEEGLIDRDTVFQRVKREHVRTLSRPVVDPSFKIEPHLIGLPACEGVVTGEACFTAEMAVQLKEQGKAAILIRHETSPDDIAGMFAAVGILTATGGATSHAAVVARGMDKVCVTGAEDLKVLNFGATCNGIDVMAGTKVTIDGATGKVWFNTDVPISDPTSDIALKKLVEFVEQAATNTMDVWLPNSPGSLYLITQFLGDVPAPTSKEVTVLDNGKDFAKSDPLVLLTGDTAGMAKQRLQAWMDKHGVEVKVVKVTDDPTLDELLSRPTSPQEIEKFFKGKLDSVAKLIAPARIEDKFSVMGCQRHRLMAAFQ